MSDGNASNRWWEYYFFRYFVGTVAGAAAIVFLLKFPGSLWYRPELLNINDVGSLGIKEITGIAALGFSFCYVASAPMLLLHASRAQLGLYPLKVRWRFWIPTAFAVFLAFFVGLSLFSFSLWSHRSLSLLMFLWVVGFQMATIIEAYLDRFDAISTFYWKIACARATESPSISGYVESYRHLREHGNASSILVLEFLLGFILYSAPKLVVAIVALVLWIAPAFCSWFIGSLLEAKLAHAPKG